MTMLGSQLFCHSEWSGGRGMRLDVRRETENKSRIIHSSNHPFLIFPLNLFRSGRLRITVICYTIFRIIELCAE